MKKNRKERACSPFSSQSSISTMSRLLDLRTERDEILAYPPPQLPPVSPSSSPDHISPTILLIIVILAAVFFISGLVHLLIRFFMKKPSSSIYQSSTRQAESSGASHALQRQLQQLFRLHDSGLDQASIDALPVFYYKHIIGLQEPFDCAVCLCEFSDQDKLRLLPVCSHAFHIQCIDTWLLSNSTCPLCRGTLVGSEIESRMVGIIRESVSSSSSPRPSIMEEYIVDKRSKQIYSVRLGKFRNFNQGGEITRDRDGSGRNLDARRCYSMGSYRYIVGDSDLQVALSPKVWKTRSQTPLSIEVTDEEGKKINGRSKGESFSVSKIWLWPKNSRFRNSSNIRINMPAHTVTVQNDYRI